MKRELKVAAGARELNFSHRSRVRPYEEGTESPSWPRLSSPNFRSRVRPYEEGTESLQEAMSVVSGYMKQSSSL